MCCCSLVLQPNKMRSFLIHESDAMADADLCIIHQLQYILFVDAVSCATVCAAVLLLPYSVLASVIETVTIL